MGGQHGGEGIGLVAHGHAALLAVLPGPLALVGHGRVEAGAVQREPAVGHDLAGHVDREAVGVVELERDRTGQLARLGERLQGAVEDGQPAAQRAPELVLLPPEGGHDGVGVGAELRVGAAHQLDGALGQARGDRVLDPEQVGEADGPADDPAQDEAPLLVGGDHTVVDQERHGAGVVGQELEGDVGLRIGTEADPGQALGLPHQGSQLVGGEHVGHADGGAEDALEAGTGVDVLGLQRPQAAVLEAEELLEHQVPVLDVAVLGRRVERAAVGAGIGAEVPEQLRGGAARARVAHLPEVVLVHPLDALGGEAHLVDPEVDRLLVVDVAGDPDPIRVQSQHLGGELPGPPDGIGLEVVAEAEVAQHLEEAEVAGRAADGVEVVVLAAGAHAALDRRGARRAPRAAAPRR